MHRPHRALPEVQVAQRDIGAAYEACQERAAAAVAFELREKLFALSIDCAWTLDSDVSGIDGADECIAQFVACAFAKRIDKAVVLGIGAAEQDGSLAELQSDI